jgi:hypothetical protein
MGASIPHPTLNVRAPRDVPFAGGAQTSKPAFLSRNYEFIPGGQEQMCEPSRLSNE